MSESVHDQDELRAVVRRLLSRDQPVNKLWEQLVGEVGVTGLLVPERLDGAGATVGDTAVVLEEAGRVPLALPLASTVALATPVLRACEQRPEAAQLLGRIATGTSATVAFAEPGMNWNAPPTMTVAHQTERGAWHLDGVKTAVPDATTVELILVTAATPTGTGIFAVTADSPRLKRHAAETFDTTKQLGTVEFADTPAALICSDDEASTATAAGLDIALALLLSEQIGCASCALDEAVDHAKSRVQFDRPIGSFQAIKHKLVEILLELELARSAVSALVQAADSWLTSRSEEDLLELRRCAHVAKAVSADGCMFVAEETLHIFGGIGFTWEHDAHRRFRRAKFGQLYLGTAEDHREQLALASGLTNAVGALRP